MRNLFNRISSWHKELTLVIFMLITYVGNSQTQTVYSNYVYNKILINPAYAGTDELFTASAAIKRDWVGLEGAPESQIFTLHAPIPAKKIALGMVVSNDKVAVLRETSVQMILGYKVYTSKHILSFGLQPTITSTRLGLSELQGIDPADPIFNSGDISETNFNFGYGMYLSHPSYYLGASFTRIASGGVNGEFTESVDEVTQTSMQVGYLADLGPTLKLQPNLLLNGTIGSPLKADMNVTLLLQERIMLGVSSKSFDTVGGTLGALLNDRITAFYTYDHAFEYQSEQVSSSHEIMIKYAFQNLTNRYISTRYF